MFLILGLVNIRLAIWKPEGKVSFDGSVYIFCNPMFYKFVMANLLIYVLHLDFNSYGSLFSPTSVQNVFNMCGALVILVLGFPFNFIF